MLIYTVELLTPDGKIKLRTVETACLRGERAVMPNDAVKFAAAEYFDEFLPDAHGTHEILACCGEEKWLVQRRCSIEYTARRIEPPTLQGSWDRHFRENGVDKL
ncbi:MAG: hypothetical protein WC505_07565 [Patescibacteria group bacterium]